ncbi:hypothetical protein VaNZ11_015805, partial [Volvox africanus]
QHSPPNDRLHCIHNVHIHIHIHTHTHTHTHTQAIVHRLTDYGVPEGQVLGICDGFKGFDPRHPAKPRPLTRHVVEGAHLRGGSMLGTSKGWADIDAVVAKIAMW